MDRLEKFIEEQRAEFEDRTPDRSIWLSIENNLNRDVNVRRMQFSVWKIAAGFILILCCGILIGLNLQSSVSDIDYTRSPELLQLKDTESYYQTQVNLKMNDIKDPASKANVTEDLKQLDEIYRQLKEEIIKSGYTNSDLLIQAMIENHKTKADILENILNKQNQIKNENLSL